MKNLIGIEDFTKQEITELIEKSKDIMENREKYSEKCKGKILGALFFEPSTRTRLSFESAMQSLGGSVLGFSSAGNTSTAKGESLSDTISVISTYTDIIAMRHPKDGAAYVASQKSKVPIINAGDGGHNHPTQTLLDLLTIDKEVGRMDNLTIGLCGDLKYGRTVHSLIIAMSMYENIKFILISPDELKIPEYLKTEVLDKKNIPYTEVTNLEENIEKLDILYMTRIQEERFENRETFERLKDTYVLDNEKLKTAKKELCIMHPLPRVNEIAPEVDDDPRACYFKQAEYGRYMRMAIILKLLAEKDIKVEKEEIYETEKTCPNTRCVVQNERGIKKLITINKETGKCSCKYCETEIK